MEPDLPKRLALRERQRDRERRVRVEAERIAERATRDLYEANSELTRIQKGLETRIEERTAALARACRDLETLLFVVAHDLREPLQSIRIFTGMIEKRHGEGLGESGRDLLGKVDRSADRMRLLLEDLSVLTRLERMESPSGPISAEVLVTDVLDRLQARILETKARIDVARPLPSLRAHPTWSGEALVNLVANALKFVRPGAAPEVEIAAVDLPEGRGLVVRDRGPGLPSEMGERIFELFRRGVGRDVEGTGAGLAIVRRIAERHGGSAWARGREGGGAEFFLILEGGRDTA